MAHNEPLGTELAAHTISRFVKPDLERYFGMLCRDKVTGFEGVAIGCITSLDGTDSYALEPLAKKNKKARGYELFDVGRLEILSCHVKTEEVNGSRPCC